MKNSRGSAFRDTDAPRRAAEIGLAPPGARGRSPRTPATDAFSFAAGDVARAAPIMAGQITAWFNGQSW